MKAVFAWAYRGREVRRGGRRAEWAIAWRMGVVGIDEVIPGPDPFFLHSLLHLLVTLPRKRRKRRRRRSEALQMNTDGFS